MCYYARMKSNIASINSGVFMVFIAALLWSTDAPFRYFLTQSYPSTFIVFAEHAVALLVSIPVLYYFREDLKRLSKKEWFSVAFIAVCGSALATIAFTYAFHYVNPSIAILLQKLQPLIVIALSALWLKERLSPRYALYAGSALIGAYFISFSGVMPTVYAGEVYNPTTIGVFLALIAVVFWAVSTVVGKHVLSHIDFKVLAALRFSIAFAFLGALVLGSSDTSYTHLQVTDFGIIVLMALVSGVASLMLYYRGLKKVPASVATIAELGFPLGAVVINWLFIPGSALTAIQLVGMAILLASIYALSTDRVTA